MKESKHKQIKDYLKSGQYLTGLKAMEKFNVYRLSSVINRLRNEGMTIKTEMIQGDENVTYAKYFLEK
jgi:negative regulator of replication initiation